MDESLMRLVYVCCNLSLEAPAAAGFVLGAADLVFGGGARSIVHNLCENEGTAWSTEGHQMEYSFTTSFRTGPAWIDFQALANSTDDVLVAKGTTLWRALGHPCGKWQPFVSQPKQAGICF